MLKLKLRIPSKRDSRQFPWSSCAPFVDNRQAQLIHRPREVSTYNVHKFPHIAVSMWCGNGSSGDTDKFTFLDAISGNKLLCARCEVAAVASGLPSADELCGKHVHIGKMVPIQTCCGKE